MAEVNSYFGLAENDFLFAKAGMEAAERLDSYNQIVSICAQAGEKYLKAVIELCFVQDDDTMRLLHSHNLRALYNKIVTMYSLSVSSLECKWLGDFYYDARYPGDNFVVASKQDADDCLAIAGRIGADVKHILDTEEESRKKRKGKLAKHLAF